MSYDDDQWDYVKLLHCQKIGKVSNFTKLIIIKV